MFGFDSPAEMINSVRDIGEELYVRPEDRKRLISLLKTSEGAIKEFEVELKRRDSSRFWVSINACMLYDANNKEPFIEGTCLDITKRKMAEDALRESEFKYRTLIEFSNDVIFCVDKNGYYLYTNKVFASTFGKTPEYFYGKSFWDVFPKEHADQRFKAVSKIFETGEAGSVEVEVPLPDKTLHFLATLNPVKDSHGNVTAVLTHSRNITDRKLAEKALKESENKLREIIENSVDNIFVADILPDRKFKVNTINGALEKFMNINRKDVENKLLDEILPEIQVRIVSDNFNKCLAGGQNYSYEEVAEFYGEKTYYSTNLAPVFDETGKAVRIIGISRDITERKLAEENIKNLLHEKELILSEVHHRVKNNMNTIYGLLKIQAGAQKSEEANDVLQNAAGRVLSMSVLYDKLYRSEDNGAISIKKYLPALIDEIVVIFPQKQALKIETSIDDVILSSKILSPLGMIINELISNTMKHAFNGCDEGFIAVTAFKKEGRIFITVMDNGPGIPESITFHNSPGLGLQLVEMLVKQINGSINIERGRGAKFIIEFEA
jgi:PAS domain S-box-containing protein